MLIRDYSSLTELWKEVTVEMFLNEDVWDSEPRGHRRISYGNKLTSGTCILNGDLNEVGLTKSRWTRYVHQYTLPNLKEVIEICRSLPEDAEQLIPVEFSLSGSGHHRRGRCLLGISYHRGCITLYSRAVSFPDRALLDLNLANRLSRLISQPKETKLVWYISLLYVQPIWSMVFLTTQGVLEQALSGPAGRQVSLILNKMLEDKDYRFKPFKRMSKRVRALRSGGELPSCPISSLKLPEERAS